MAQPSDRSSFRWLVVAQFLGAFNDNLFKQLLLLLAAKWLFPGQDVQGLAFAVFSLPFLLFSGIAGDLSERLSKRTVIVAMKAAEVGIMLLGALALQSRAFGLSADGHWHFLLVVLFLMGTHSAFFGPSKYGVLPEIVAEGGLLQANGLIAMTTFLSILAGQAVAGPLLDWFATALWVSGAVCALLAVVGFACASRMAPLPPTRPDLRLGWSPFGSLFATMRGLMQDRGLFTVVVVNSMFWFNGGVLQQAVNGLGGDAWLATSATENWMLSMLLVTLAACIMVGCVLAPRVAAVVRPSRMVVLGAGGMVLGQAALVLVGPVVTRATGGYLLAHVALGCAGLCGAMFVVPVTTCLQDAPEKGNKGRTFAVNNFCNFVCIFLAGGFYLLGRQLGLSPALLSALAGGLLLLSMLARPRWLQVLGRASDRSPAAPERG